MFTNCFNCFVCMQFMENKLQMNQWAEVVSAEFNKTATAEITSEDPTQLCSYETLTLSRVLLVQSWLNLSWVYSLMLCIIIRRPLLIPTLYWRSAFRGCYSVGLELRFSATQRAVTDDRKCGTWAGTGLQLAWLDLPVVDQYLAECVLASPLKGKTERLIKVNYL